MEGLTPMETALMLMCIGMGTVFIILILIILFGSGCDDSSKTSFTPKPAKKQSFTPSDDTPSEKPQSSSREKKKPLEKKCESIMI